MKIARNLLGNARQALNGLALAVALSMGLVALAPVAMAQPGGSSAGSISGSVGLAGQTSTFGGTITSSTNNTGTSSSIAAAQTNGYGTSYQAASNAGSGLATAGGSIGPSGVTTTNGQYTSSISQTAGTITGNSPITADNGSIMNGSSGFGSSTVNTSSYGTFASTIKGGTLDVSGYANYSAKGYGFDH